MCFSDFVSDRIHNNIIINYLINSIISQKYLIISKYRIIPEQFFSFMLIFANLYFPIEQKGYFFAIKDCNSLTQTSSF